MILTFLHRAHLPVILALALCLNSMQLFSQGEVIGRVFDFTTNQPVDQVNLLITDEAKKPMGSTTTDTAGNFKISNLPFGFYRIRATSIGYNNYVRDSIPVLATKPSMVIRPIRLKSDTAILKDVVVNATKEDVINEIDKKVYRLNNNLAAEGGSVLDAMRNLPSVQVSVNGRVSLRGSRNVTILIDGKQSALTGSSKQAILDNLQASSVESIEVITNPGSEYDADGSAGIINIVTKKGGLRGTNGSISVSGSTWNKAVANAYLAYNTAKINFFFNYYYRIYNTYNTGVSDKNIFKDSADFFLIQNRSGVNGQGNHTGRVGLTYNFNDRYNISFSGMGRYENQGIINLFDQQKLRSDRALDSASKRAGISKYRNYGYEVDLSFEKKFKNNKHKLTAECTYSVNNTRQNTSLRTFYLDSSQNLRIALPKLRNISGLPYNRTLMGRIDYHLPLPHKLNFAAGVKATVRWLDNDYSAEDFDYPAGIWSGNVSLTNHYQYNENVFAGYTNIGHILGKFSYKLGLRVEYTIINSTQVTLNKKYSSRYISPFPTLHLKYQLNDKSDFSFSYSRRINRPDASSLDPFPNVINPYLITSGNPNLKPEYINATEFSYSFKNNKHAVTASVYYRYSTDVIGRYNTLGEGGISNITFQNLASTHSGGAELIVRNQFFPWWKLMTSANLYYYKVNANNLQADLTSSSVGGLIKMVSTFNMFKTLDLQLTGSCFLPQASAQTTTKTYGTLDLALRNSFWKNRFILTLSVSDLFNTNIQRTITQGAGFTTTASRKYESRIAQLTLTFKFGKTSSAKDDSKMEEYSRELLDDGDN